jgi:hypothetical protein
MFDIIIYYELVFADQKVKKAVKKIIKRPR